MERNVETDEIQQMRDEISREKERKQYDTNEPWEPMKRPSVGGKIALSVFIALLMSLVFVFAASYIGTLNSGQQFNVLGLFSL